MSHHIPFEIQSEIIKMLPVKSLVQFRSVSKQWKAFIDNPEFINNYHINHTNPQHHLLVQHELDDTDKTFTSIVDDTTFPQQKFPLTAPESFSLLTNTITLSSVNGLLCFIGSYGDVFSKTHMAIIWNPVVRKSVSILIPKAVYMRTIIVFGACPDTSDPKLVKMTVSKIGWEVDVFSLTTRVWKTVYTGAPFKSCKFHTWCQVFVNGIIYFRAHEDIYLDEGVRSYFILSFDLKNEKFGEVCLPDRLVHTHDVIVKKVNESLGLLEYNDEGEISVCGVWMREDGVNKTFSKIYTIKVEGKSLFGRVLGFRNNGDVVIELDDDNYGQSEIEIYEPSSGLINGVGINGNRYTFYTCSYMETLLLLDEPNSIIY